MRKADLIAIDMDGTLLRSDNTLSNRNIEAVHAFHEAGGKVFLISGRPDGMTLPYVAELDDVDLYASFNGAYFGDRQGKALWARPIEENTLRSVYRSEEHTSELQSRQDISYAAFCLKKEKS